MKVVPLAFSSLRLRVNFERGQFTEKHSLMFCFVHNNITVAFSNVSYSNIVSQHELFRYINIFWSGLNSLIKILIYSKIHHLWFENYKVKDTYFIIIVSVLQNTIILKENILYKSINKYLNWNLDTIESQYYSLA